MSLRSDPTVNPTKPDPVTRNQPDVEKLNTNEGTGTGRTRGNYASSGNSTSSGGYGGAPEEVWSNKAQRGVDMPLGPDEISKQSGSDYNSDTGLIDQSTSGINLEDKIQDAPQGRDLHYTTNAEEEEWGIEKGAGKDY